MSDTIPVELDERQIPNVELYEPILVHFEGEDIECRCMGWRHNQDGSWEIKTDKGFGQFWSTAVPMEDVRIMITPREAELRKQLASMKESNEQH